MNPFLRFALIVAGIIAAGIFCAVLGFYGVRAYYEPRLPAVDSLHELKLGIPLRVYSQDGALIGEFGAERRDPLRYEQIPRRLVQAFLAAEDDRFFEHPGVDLQGLIRASLVLATTGEKRQGGSTITMQLARNVFLTPERSFTRKIKEILLALKIERELNKQQILELYLNRIFLGNRAYGVGAAAQVYFGKDVDHLSVGEMATLAGLPKAPSRDNPIADPRRAKERRDYVLRRMHELRDISDGEYKLAQAEPITAHQHVANVQLEASYVAEMVRAEMVAKYGEAAYSDGYSVITTIDSARQKAANAALRGGIFAYEERHGYRGAEAKLPPEAMAELDSDPDGEAVQAELDARPQAVSLIAGVVLQFSPDHLKVQTETGVVDLPKSGFDWARLSDKKPLNRGDIIRLARVDGAWRLTQLPKVEGALISVNPGNGAIQALVGGYDFFLGAYNRVTQARRQPGSSFKPFLYTAALSKGYTPASVFLDAPVVFVNTNPDDDWRPGNYEGKFNGPMRLRVALAESRNLVSIRVLQAVGIDYAIDFAGKFGLPKDRLPKDLTLALGSGSLTPWEMARGYSVFANGGFLVEPYFIQSIRGADGKDIFTAQPKQACPACDAPAPDAAAAADAAVDAAGKPDGDKAAAAPATPQSLVPEADRAPRTLDADLDYIITSMMHEVVTRGTGAAVRSLGRDDLAGKTGTTNDFTDAWFNGFNPGLVTVTWIGYDQPTTLGHGEVGAKAALPIWMDYMKIALKGVPQQVQPRPPGVVVVPINPANGKLLPDGSPGAIMEVVQADHVPSADDGKSTLDEQPAGADIY